MKKNKLVYALCALMSAGVTSCDLTEKPTSFYEMDTYFNTVDKAKMAVIGAYDCIAAEGSYGQYVMPFFTSDDMYMIRGTDVSDNTRRGLSHYSISSSNAWIASVLNYTYQGIDRANLAVAGIERMAGYEESSELKALAAQARFLRAYLAFDLIRFWGDVPFKIEYTNGYEQTSQPRMDREAIYDAIINDLDFAKVNLGKAGDNGYTSPEVPCRGAARALLMRVYLQRAGYSLDRATHKLVRPDDAKRKEYFDAVIEEWKVFGTEGYHKFFTGGYEKLFKTYSELVLNNQESLWEIAFEPNNGEKDNAGYWATWNGPAVNEPKAGSANQSHMGRANAFHIVLPYWKYFYEDTDERRDVNFVDYVYIWDATAKMQVKDWTTAKEMKNMERYPGKWRREWMAKGFVDPNHTGVNYCPLRYADVVLMAAEAYNETGDTPTAWTLLNSVRDRAGATAITPANYESLLKAPKVYNLPFISDGDEAGKFRTALYWERAFELCYEGQRKFDLIRWGILGDALRAAQTYLENWSDGANEWYGAGNWDPVDWATKNYIAGRNFVDGKHELLPIPLAEIQSNAQLNGENNPGYE